MATQLSTLDLLTQHYRVLLTIPEVAEITSIQPQTIRNRLARGDFPIPSLKVGRRRLFRVVDVAAFLDRLAGVDTGGFLAVARHRGRPTKAEQARRQGAAADGR